MTDGTFLLKTKNLSIYPHRLYRKSGTFAVLRRGNTLCHVEPTSSHMGIKRTVHRVTERFFWKGVTKDVEYMVRNCSVATLVS